MKFDAIVVGGGIAGLTATAYLAKAGFKTLLCEKEDTCGGLVNSFERDGFFYDGGIRAMENSGILFPMLKNLGLKIEFVKNVISVGFEDQVIWIHSENDVDAYQELLINLYPESKSDIINIIAEIRRIMHYMEVQYGINNPAFLDFQEDREYMLKKVVPWMFRYAFTVRKIAALNQPIVPFLKRFTQNQALIDIISQHFFQETPAFFALSYIKLYLDYYYPLGGTGKVVKELVEFIEKHHGTIRTSTQITSLDPVNKTVTDKQGNTDSYQRLIWAADLKTLYKILNLNDMPTSRVKSAILDRHAEIEDKIGNDSIFTLFLGVNLDKTFFSSKNSEHFFYTPSREGESVAGPVPIGEDQATIEKWLAEFFALTTYEIAIPVLRDESLAQEGKTGLVISVLFDYALTRYIQEMRWYQAFKTYAENCIITTLENSIYPGLQEAIVHQFSSTPLTMEKIAGNTDGAITGWSYTNRPLPAESRLVKIFSASQTPIPGIYQAGQWTYSPSGLPISILTGKLASDRVIKDLKKLPKDQGVR